MSCHEMNLLRVKRMRGFRVVNWKAYSNCRASCLPRTTGPDLRGLTGFVFLRPAESS
jgi:hypothetical protein